MDPILAQILSNSDSVAVAPGNGGLVNLFDVSESAMVVNCDYLSINDSNGLHLGNTQRVVSAQKSWKEMVVKGQTTSPHMNFHFVPPVVKGHKVKVSLPSEVEDCWF